MSSSTDSGFPEPNTPLVDFGLGRDSLSDKVAFPQLSEAELAEVVPFGERCSFATDEALFCAGDYPFNSHAILSGTVRIVDISTGERVVFVRYGPGLLHRRH
jgi:hypothetical protein